MSGDTNPPTLDVQALWAKYEDIAMHFNDLLMRLRSQSLAGIAAISTLVGLFSKEGIADVRVSWSVATAIFFAMAFFWIAIWCLDFFYYNRLLLGAVSAITKLERDNQKNGAISIEMSTLIEKQFYGVLFRHRFFGVHAFYGIVLAVIFAGAGFSLTKFLQAPSTPPAAVTPAKAKSAANASRASAARPGVACAASARGCLLGC
jgi:hypothetical protein